MQLNDRQYNWCGDPPRKDRTDTTTGKARVEIVDHNHARWRCSGNSGSSRRLIWTRTAGSPRQRMLVAFVGNEPAGHLCFHLHPVDRGNIQAKLDALGFTSAETAVQLTRLLRQEALLHAKKLNCSDVKDLELPGKETD